MIYAKMPIRPFTDEEMARCRRWGRRRLDWLVILLWLAVGLIDIGIVCFLVWLV